MTGKAGQQCSDGSTIMPNTLPRENQTMSLDRREFLAASLAASAAACQQRIAERQTAATDPEAQPGIPGPYPGRVVAVDHPGSIVAGEYQRGAVRGMIERGLNELTHAESLVDSLRKFFEPGDVVGIKVNGVGRPYVISGTRRFSTLSLTDSTRSASRTGTSSSMSERRPRSWARASTNGCPTACGS